MARVNYSVLINKAIQKYNLDNNYDRDYPFWEYGKNPVYLYKEGEIKICFVISKTAKEIGPHDLRLYALNNNYYIINNVYNNYVLLYKEDNAFKELKKYHVYKLELVKDIFTICMKPNDYVNDLYIYKNDNLVYKVENIMDFTYKSNTIKYRKKEMDKSVYYEIDLNVVVG